LALFAPKLGKFNVTAKGGQVNEEYFDWKIALPYLLILLLNGIGLCVGVVRLFWWNSQEWGTVLFNLVWTGYNLMLLWATLAVAMEQKQVRRHWRVQLAVPAMIRLGSGRTVACETTDFSEGGLALKLSADLQVEVGASVTASIFRGEREFSLSARVAYCQGTTLRLRFDGLGLSEYQSLVAATFSRGDAWLKWLPVRELDRPLQGLKEIFLVGLEGQQRLLKSLAKVAVPKRFRTEAK
jgi:cellulose synthase (UDP-forming)